MDELAYARHIKRAKDAENVYCTIRELYGWEIPWKKAYRMSIQDKLLSKEEKDLVEQFHPVI